MNTEIQTGLRLSKDDVKQIPEKVNAVIVDIKKTVAGFALKNDFKKPDIPYLQIFLKNDEFDIAIIDNFRYYEGEELTSNTKLGKLINKYEDIQVGKIVILQKNQKGYWAIAL